MPYVAIIETKIKVYEDRPDGTLVKQVENKILNENGIVPIRMKKVFGKTIEEVTERLKK